MNLIDRIKKMPLGIKIACSAAVITVIAAIVVAIVLSRNGYIAYTKHNVTPTTTHQLN